MEYGPFRPQIPVGVPLWLAMILKKQGKCNVVPPRWLDVTTLNNVNELERSDDVFQVNDGDQLLCERCMFMRSWRLQFPYNYRRLYLFTTSNSQLTSASTHARIYKIGVFRMISWYLSSFDRLFSLISQAKHKRYRTAFVQFGTIKFKQVCGV